MLATTTADSVGNIDVTIRVPADAEPGPYALVATQDVERDNGELVPAHGTPTRASLIVGEAPAADPPPAAVSQPLQQSLRAVTRASFSWPRYLASLVSGCSLRVRRCSCASR